MTWTCVVCGSSKEKMLMPGGWFTTKNPDYLVCGEMCLIQLYADIRSEQEAEYRQEELERV